MSACGLQVNTLMKQVYSKIIKLVSKSTFKFYFVKANEVHL